MRGDHFPRIYYCISTPSSAIQAIISFAIGSIEEGKVLLYNIRNFEHDKLLERTPRQCLHHRGVHQVRQPRSFDHSPGPTLLIPRPLSEFSSLVQIPKVDPQTVSARIKKDTFLD